MVVSVFYHENYLQFVKLLKNLLHMSDTLVLQPSAVSSTTQERR